MEYTQDTDFAALQDLWLLLPFTLGFLFFRSAPGTVVEKFICTQVYGQLESKEVLNNDPVNDQYTAVRGELSAIRAEIFQERRMSKDLLTM